VGFAAIAPSRQYRVNVRVLDIWHLLWYERDGGEFIMGSRNAKIATLDLETDPFEYGKIVQPFLGGYYDGKRIISFWGPDCIARLVEALEEEAEPLTIYVHNGGRFDFFYFLQYLAHSTRIVNGRIISARLGKHEFRDYDKDSIDYQKFAETEREKHHDEIMRYFRKDLTALYELVTAFRSEFGDRLTIGGASMKQLKLRHTYKRGSAAYDAKFRVPFYYGGRVQVFKAGVTRGPVKIYDVNSMYPFVMQAFLHPIGTAYSVSRYIERDTVFVVTVGRNYGAFPVRTKTNGLNFTCEHGTFSCTLHEFHAAIETGCYRPHRILKTYGWKERGTFEDFVSHFYDARAKAAREGDKIRKIFYKYVLNSAYGKFAQNPDNYFDWYITKAGETPPEWHECGKGCEVDCSKSWSPAYLHDEYVVWKRPLQTKSLSWYNIATGASITGAARAVLLRGIHASQSPYYCDTDSIICESLSGVASGDSGSLGGWKLEATGSMVAIAGKKMYAVFDRTNPTLDYSIDEGGHVVKKACKGVKLSGLEILRIAGGEEIEYANPVPAFRWDGTAVFTKRRIRRTA
jgi:Vibrio phage DNA polymerase